MTTIIVGGSALCVAAAGASLTAAPWPPAATRQVPTVSLAYVTRMRAAALPAGQEAIPQSAEVLALARAKGAAAQAGAKLTLLRFNAGPKGAYSTR